MNQQNTETLGREKPGSGASPASCGSGGLAGLILILGAAAAWFLTVASAATLATTSRVLFIAGLVGLVAMAFVVALRAIAGGHGGGGGRPGRRRPATGNPGAEVFTIIDRGRIRPIPVRSAGGHSPRRVAYRKGIVSLATKEDRGPSSGVVSSEDPGKEAGTDHPGGLNERAWRSSRAA